MSTVYCDYHLLLDGPLPQVEARRNPEHPAKFFVNTDTGRAHLCTSGTYVQLTGLLADQQTALDHAAGRPAHPGALAGLLAAIRDLASIDALGDDPYAAVLTDAQRAQECAHRLAFLARALTGLLDTDPADPHALRDAAERLHTRAGKPAEQESSAA